MAKTKIEKLANIDEQMEQLANKRKLILQQHKAQERKDRTKRLCKRAGLLESLLPDTVTLTEEQFKAFLEQTVTTEESRCILAGMKPQDATADAQESAETAAQGHDTPALHPAATGQHSGAGREQDGGISPLPLL